MGEPEAKPLIPRLEMSETPRTDAFVDSLPPIPMQDPQSCARAVREVLMSFAEFARELEREGRRKVWPH